MKLSDSKGKQYWHASVPLFRSKMAEVKTAASARGSLGPLDTKNRDAIASGVFELLKPAVDEIDDRVKTVR